jgi:ATP-dependent protease Clp ATPase subunit
VRNCSFCCHGEEVVEKLIVRDDVAICDRCIALCNIILNEPKIQGAKEYDSWRYAAEDKGEK